MRRAESRLPLITFAAAVVVAVIAFGWYAVHRQQVADRRWQVTNAQAEKQRQAICAILANIPGKVPPEIQRARVVFARPGHPRDCYPLSKTTPTPSSAKAGSSPAAAPTVVVVPASPRPAPHPSPTSTPKPRPTGTPSPSPSPTCSTVHDVLAHPIDCLHL